MRSLWRKLEALFAATAFAEEGDTETARRLMASDDAEAPAPARSARPAPRVEAAADAPHAVPAPGRARLG